MLKGMQILVKGAGDFASGAIRRLHLAGAKVTATELPQPLTIRRMVAFSEAVFNDEHAVEDIIAVKAGPNEIEKYHSEGKIPVLVDPETNILKQRKFEIVIDGRMAKKNLGTIKNEAHIVIALGPGFEAGVNCDAVVETLAGHNLGRVIYKGKPLDDTGIPIPTELQNIPCTAGFAPCCSGFEINDYLLRAPADGMFKAEKQIGDLVEVGDTVGSIEDASLQVKIAGVLRGLVHDGVYVKKGMKIGDIDPSGDKTRVYQISEKANAIAGGVLEACLFLLNKD